MQTVFLQLPEPISGVVADRKKCRSILFFVFCSLLLILASLSALSAGALLNPAPTSQVAVSSVFSHDESDNSLRGADSYLLAMSNTSARFSVTRGVQRLLLRANNQYRTQNYKIAFTLLLVWQTMLSNLIPCIYAFLYGLFAALFHFQIILKTVLPVRAGPSRLTTVPVALPI